eukprot:148940-Rhodomonas_salina.3
MSGTDVACGGGARLNNIVKAGVLMRKLKAKADAKYASFAGLRPCRPPRSAARGTNVVAMVCEVRSEQRSQFYRSTRARGDARLWNSECCAVVAICLHIGMR